MAPSPASLTELQRAAGSDGRRCLAGAIIVDVARGVFVQRRSADRKLLPGLWDIAGGHVEQGETLLDALSREVSEETGWAVGDASLAYVSDWEVTDRQGEVRRYREFDFVVEVEGDLDHPRLEEGKHDDLRWVGEPSLSLLDENRGRDHGMIRRLVELGLRSCRPEPLSYPHATIFLDPAVTERIEELRRVWDPAMTSQIAAHVTVAYPDEVGDVSALRRVVERCTEEVTPFRLAVGAVAHHGDPAGGIHVEVADVDGGWRTLRGSIAGPAASRVTPHVSLPHPRTTDRGARAWQRVHGSVFEGEWLVERVSITAFDRRRWRTVDTFALGEGQGHLVLDGP